jgi:GT2 family glycosyltransferase
MIDKILIIIPVLNLWDQYTIHCMDSIAANKCDIPFEVLIVNQASTDQTINKATDFGGRKMPGRVHLINNEKNTGCGGGWNQGVEWGLERAFTHFIIANNDILVGPNAIQAMYTRMKREPAVLLCSAVDVIREVPVPQFVLDETKDVNKKPDTEAPHPNFSCFMINRECVEKVGMFDEGFFPAYFEDNDFHYRLKLAGGNDCAIANTTAVFIHYGSRTQNQNAGAPIVPGEMFQKNRGYFITKWGGEPTREKFTHPFNDPNLDIKHVKRN